MHEQSRSWRATPTVAMVDSQTDRTALKGGSGYDAGKKIKGRKRHIVVDTPVNLLAVVVHSAGIQDRVGARAVLTRLFCRTDTIPKAFVDGGYTGKLIDWAEDMFGYDMEVMKRNEQHTSRCYPSDGLSNAPSLGSTDPEDSPKTTNQCTGTVGIRLLYLGVIDKSCTCPSRPDGRSGESAR